MLLPVVSSSSHHAILLSYNIFIILTQSAEKRAGVGMALGSLALFSAIGMAAQQQHNAVPFTAQEWWWAIQGGYLDTMVAHFVRNGGL